MIVDSHSLHKQMIIERGTLQLGVGYTHEYVSLLRSFVAAFIHNKVYYFFASLLANWIVLLILSTQFANNYWQLKSLCNGSPRLLPIYPSENILTSETCKINLIIYSEGLVRTVKNDIFRHKIWQASLRVLQYGFWQLSKACCPRAGGTWCHPMVCWAQQYQLLLFLWKELTV